MKSKKPKFSSSEYKKHLKKEMRQEGHSQRLESPKTVCSSCGFNVSAALTRQSFQKHHIEGNRQAKLTGEPEGQVSDLCLNCHAILTDKQQDTPPSLYDKDQTGVTRLARYLQGQKDLLILTAGWLGAWVTYLVDLNGKIPPGDLNPGPSSPEAIL